MSQNNNLIKLYHDLKTFALKINYLVEDHRSGEINGDEFVHDLEQIEKDLHICRTKLVSTMTKST
jgi:hypothetical protein